MKRAWVVLGSAGLLLALGCGTQNYDFRIEQTIDKMNYDRRLDENLMPPAKGKLEELGIYLRPPMNLAGPTQTFQMTVVEPGRFDLETSFTEPDAQSLHVIARVDRPKAAAKKGAPPQPEAEAPRGNFEEEVLGLVRNVSGADVAPSQLKEEQKHRNTFRALTLVLEAKTIEVHIFDGSKSNVAADRPYKVALIFEYLTERKNAVTPKIGLCLESFAVGDVARRAFAGGDIDEMGDEGGEYTGPPI